MGSPPLPLASSPFHLVTVSRARAHVRRGYRAEVPVRALAVLILGDRAAQDRASAGPAAPDRAFADRAAPDRAARDPSGRQAFAGISVDQAI